MNKAPANRRILARTKEWREEETFDSRRGLGRGAREVSGECLDVLDAGIGDLAPSDLLQGPTGNTRLVRDLRPAPASGQQLANDVLVYGIFHTSRIDPTLGLVNPQTGLAKR